MRAHRDFMRHGAPPAAALRFAINFGRLHPSGAGMLLRFRQARASLAAIAFVSVAACKPPPPQPFDPLRDIGVAIFDSTAGCAAFPRSDLPAGTLISLIDVQAEGDGHPTIVGEARITGLLTRGDLRCPPELRDAADHQYQIQFASPVHGLIGPVFAVIEEPQDNAPPGTLTLPLLSRIAEIGRFRTCTSSEGLHLTFWRGTAITGERLFHRYYPLGYDVEPTCREEDWAGRVGRE